MQQDLRSHSNEVSGGVEQLGVTLKSTAQCVDFFLGSPLENWI